MYVCIYACMYVCMYVYVLVNSYLVKAPDVMCSEQKVLNNHPIHTKSLVPKELLASMPV